MLLVLLWLGGLDLRVTLLAVPPVIPNIHHDLGLDEKGISVLTGLPVLLLAAAAIPGALLIARLGVRRALVAGLVLIAVGSVLRGAGPSLAVLFAFTLLMGVGVAVSQPVFPTLTGDWFPARLGLATAVYTNGMLVGETLPAALTGPLILPLLNGSWPLVFAFWSLPVLLTTALVLMTTREVPRPAGDEPRRWWPDFRSRQTWLIGLTMGCASAAYFGTNAFLPDFVHATGRAALKDPALAALNTCQLVASFAVLALSRRLVGRRGPFLVAACLILAATLGIVALPGGWVVAAAGVVGFATALALVLTLALPPLLAPPGDVARFSAGILVVIYGFSFAGPLIGGAAWDGTGLPAAAFLALAAGAGLMAVLAAIMPLNRRPYS
jgi:CP family cyanate transporter-like MFS transporter